MQMMHFLVMRYQNITQGGPRPVPVVKNLHHE